MVVGNFELVVSESDGTSRLKREFQAVSLTSALTFYRPANCGGAIFASSKTMKKLHQDELGDQLDEEDR